MMLTSSLGALIGFNSTDHLDQIPEGAALIGDASADLSVGPGPLAFRDLKADSLFDRVSYLVAAFSSKLH